MYEESADNGGNVRKWCRFFRGGMTNVLDEERNGRLSLVTDDLKGNVNEN
jgi:hypothetical protein